MVDSANKSGAIETSAPVAEFPGFLKSLRQPAWLTPLRQSGIAAFTAQGFPTLRDEDWRFTNIAPITKLSFKRASDQASDPAAAHLLNRSEFVHLPGIRMVFVNGHFRADLSRTGTLPGGATATSLTAALTEGSALLQQHLGQHAGINANAFAALNQAFFTDGAFIQVPAGVTLNEPVQLIFISSSQQPAATSHPRNLIVAGPHSRLTVVESYLATDGAAHFTNAVTELVAGDHAFVEHIKFQDEAATAFHMATIHGHFGRASNVSVHSFALGARLSRNNIHTNLAGEGLECVLNGLYLTRGEQLADHHMVVEHAQPNCASHEYFNGILDDKSKGVFHGRIYVHPVAQKTDAKQTNKNLLLSDDATADTKPQLEIYADDVKCTHGATIGQLNEESIFYLRSRGLGPDTARRMLIHAFAGEIIERVKCDSARETLDKIIWDRLESNPHLAEQK
jgi:Fe-S cluster assembly protein SufD